MLEPIAFASDAKLGHAKSSRNRPTGNCRSGAGSELVRKSRASFTSNRDSSAAVPGVCAASNRRTRAEPGRPRPHRSSARPAERRHTRQSHPTRLFEHVFQRFIAQRRGAVDDRAGRGGTANPVNHDDVTRRQHHSVQHQVVGPVGQCARAESGARLFVRTASSRRSRAAVVCEIADSSPPHKTAAIAAGGRSVSLPATDTRRGTSRSNVPHRAASHRVLR